MMQIHYVLTPADILAINYHHLQKDPNSIKRVRLYRALGALFILFLALVFARKSLGILFVLLAIAAAVFFMVPSLMAHNIKQQIKFRYRFGAHTEELGERTVIVENKGLRFKTPEKTSFYNYKNMIRVDEEVMFYVVYTGETQVIYVPFTAFESSQQRESFKQAVQEGIAQAKEK